jgi:GTP cyclohydrolase FolE2
MKMNSSLLEDYYWNMKAQSHRLAPCTTDQCRAKILCALQWYTTKHEYDTCVTANTEQSQIFAAVEQIEKEFSSHAAYQVIGMTLCAVAGAILTVVAIAQTLRKGGIIKSSTQREEETEDLFPML